jgi:hypothetical protein
MACQRRMDSQADFRASCGPRERAGAMNEEQPGVLLDMHKMISEFAGRTKTLGCNPSLPPFFLKVNEDTPAF